MPAARRFGYANALAQARDLQWNAVDSSRVSFIAYDFDNRNVHVVFSNNGQGWVYKNVDYEVWRRFMRSASKGKFINRILNQYDHESSNATP